MNRISSVAVASAGVFLGSLLADELLGDGIQQDDVQQALLVAAIAAGIQWWLNSRQRP